MRYYKIRLLFLFGLLAFIVLGISLMLSHRDSTYTVPQVKEGKVKTFSFK